MGFRDRVGRLFGRKVSPVPEDPRNAEVAPKSPNSPDLPKFGGVGQTNVDKDKKTYEVIHAVDALLGRVTYGAGPTYTRYSSYPAEGLEPYTIRQILHLADLGEPWQKAELDEQILERDAHLRGIDLARRVEVSGKPFRIQPANETPLASAVAGFVRATLEEIDSLDQSVEDLLSANGRGYSASEITWRFANVRLPDPSGSFRLVELLVPVRLDYVHQKHFRFDQLTDEPYLILASGNYSLPPGKFLFHAAAGTGLIERRGFMRACVWLHAAKQWATRDWLVFLHLFGLPQIQGQYDGFLDQQDAQRAIYEKILRDFGQGIPAITDDKFSLKVDNPPTGGTANSPHAAMIGWANAEMSKVVQGETLTTEVGGVGSYAIGNVHQDTRHAIVVGDARKLARTFRSDLFYPLIEMNMEALASAWGASPDEIRACIPKMAWRIDRETSPKERAEIISLAINEWGLEVDEEQQRDEFALNPPRPGSKPLPGKAVTTSSGGVTTGTLEASVKGVDNPQPTNDAAVEPQKDDK